MEREVGGKILLVAKQTPQLGRNLQGGWSIRPSALAPVRFLPAALRRVAPLSRRQKSFLLVC